MQQNTWKYFPFLKIAFSENIYFPENILHEPNTAFESEEKKREKIEKEESEVK